MTGQVVSPGTTAGAPDASPAPVLRLRPRFRGFPVVPDGLFLFSERDPQFLEGRVFADLAPHLARGATAMEIAEALAGAHPREVTHFALELLRRRGVLTDEARDGPERAVAAFWEELGHDPARAAERLAALSVAVTAWGDAAVEPVLAALRAAGVRAQATEDPAGHTLHVVLTDDHLDPGLARIGATDRRAGRPWLLVRTTGVQLWLGPLFVPDGGCYECLATRLGANTAPARYVARRSGSRRGLAAAAARSPLHDPLVAGLVTLAVTTWAVDPARGCLGGGVRVIDLATLQSSEHPLHRRPQCPACGDPTLQARRMTSPVVLTPGAGPPPTPRAALRRFVSPVTGIVARLAPAPTGLPSIHTYTASFGFGGDASDLAGLKNSALSQGSGVGETEEEAQESALCEALERHCGSTSGDEPSIRARFADLDAGTALAPDACMLYSDAQYARRDAINAEGAPFNLVPRRFDETAVLDWSGVWSLTAGRFRLLPSSYLFYFWPQPPGGPFCWADSNGCAAGATLADAVRRGLYELIERDAVAVWWYNRLRRPAVDLSGCDDPHLDALAEAYDELDRDLWALDLTGDLGVPCFAAISRRRNAEREEIILGFGAHLDAPAALRHAVSEMHHALPAVLPANRTADGDYPYPDASQRHWWRTASTASEPYLLPAAGRRVTAATYRRAAPTGDADQVAVLRAVLERAGMEVLVLDQTRPDVGLPVAKVIVPGLRHFWARFAPGRLYDVPVRLGWLPEATPEDRLNPIAMFL